MYRIFLYTETSCTNMFLLVMRHFIIQTAPLHICNMHAKIAPHLDIPFLMIHTTRMPSDDSPKKPNIVLRNIFFRSRSPDVFDGHITLDRNHKPQRTSFCSMTVLDQEVLEKSKSLVPNRILQLN